MAYFLWFKARRGYCRIHNKSNSTMKLIPKSYLDGAAASHGLVRGNLVREIPPNGFIDVDSRKYDLNEINFNSQMKIHFVATNGGGVRLIPNGLELANLEPVLFHHELRGQIYLTYVERQEFVADEYPGESF